MDVQGLLLDTTHDLSVIRRLHRHGLPGICANRRRFQNNRTAQIWKNSDNFAFCKNLRG